MEQTLAATEIPIAEVIKWMQDYAAKCKQKERNPDFTKWFHSAAIFYRQICLTEDINAKLIGFFNDN